jgi:hypothetical protein
VSNNNKNRGGGGGGENNKITIFANIIGKRDNAKVSVVLRRGRIGLVRETLQFRLGTADHPHGPWIMDPDTPANRYALQTDQEGEKESRAFDFSSDDCKGYSQILVVYKRTTDPAQGIYEQAVQLPVAEATEGPKQSKKSGKRLQFQAPESSLKSTENLYHLPMLRTLSKDGKANAEEVIFTSTEPVTLVDRSTDKPLSYNGKSARKTKYFTYKTPGTGLVLINCQLEGALECTVEIVHVESAETAAVKMEFEY